MLIQSIDVKNFCSIKEETLDCDRLTVIIGRNGAGKSTFLKCINMFFDTGASFSEEDFFNRQIEEIIEIRITFDTLQPKEIEEFSPYVHDQELIVTKRVAFENGAFISRYYAAKKQLPQFAEIRSIISKADRKSRWNELVEADTIQGLVKGRGADHIEQMMQEYESAHLDLLQPIEQEAQFFGPKNIGGGKLDKFTKYVLVPAVREVTDETVGKKGAIEQLLKMVVLRRVNSRSDIQAFKAEFEQQAREIFSTENLSEIMELSNEISIILDRFAPGSKLNLKWAEFEPPDLSPPNAVATLVEDEFEGDISHKGHGLQRALILTLLQYLAETSVKNIANDLESDEESTTEEASITIEGPDLILAIEEPELYLHPSRCRYLSTLLYSLCQDAEIHSETKTQVIYTSHSPYFVDLPRFDQIRLVRKEKPVTGMPRTKVTSYSLGTAASELAHICERPPDSFTHSTFKARAMSVMNVIVNEGFFSRTAVVVEGISDVGMLWKVQEVLELNWAERGIAIVPAGGKNNIDRPVVIFRGLGIPVYFVFDGDAHHQGRSEESKAKARNHIYQRMAGVIPVDFPETQVHETWAVFREDIETAIKSELGDDVFTRIRDEAARELGYDEQSRVLKTIEGSAMFVERAYELGHKLPTLESIARLITQLNPT